MSFSGPSYVIVRRPTRINLGLCMAQNEFRQIPNSKNPSIIGRAKKLTKKDSDVSKDDMALDVSLNQSKCSLEWNIDDKDCDTDLEDEGNMHRCGKRYHFYYLNMQYIYIYNIYLSQSHSLFSLPVNLTAVIRHLNSVHLRPYCSRPTGPKSNFIALVCGRYHLGVMSAVTEAKLRG